MVFFLESEKLENVYRLKIRIQETKRKREREGQRERERKKERGEEEKKGEEEERKEGNREIQTKSTGKRNGLPMMQMPGK